LRLASSIAASTCTASSSVSFSQRPIRERHESGVLPVNWVKASRPRLNKSVRGSDAARSAVLSSLILGPRSLVLGPRSVVEGSREFAEGSREFAEGSREFAEGAREFAEGSQGGGSGNREGVGLSIFW
jgi:hypothetical protein